MDYRKLKFQCLTLLLKKYHYLTIIYWTIVFGIQLMWRHQTWAGFHKIIRVDFNVTIVQKDQGDEGDLDYHREIRQVSLKM